MNPSLARILYWQIVIPIVLLVLGIYHGFVQVLYRAGIIKSNSFLGLDYYQGLTLHGVVNAVVLTTFFHTAFGTWVVSDQLKKTPNVKLAGLAFWTMLIGTVIAALAIMSGQASVLFTFYPPLRAHPSFYIGATLLVVGSWISFFNWIPCYLSWRRENPGKKTPLGVFGMFASFTVWMFATVPLAVEVLGMLIPWSMGWVDTINVPLARTLFWFFGHPLVYFWIMPAYVMYYVMLPKLAGGKLFSEHAARLVFCLFMVLSAPIGIHHQYTEPGIPVFWKWVHGIMTLAVGIPSFMTAFTLAASLEHGARQKGGQGLFKWWGKLPYLSVDPTGGKWLFDYFFAGLLLFLSGGITGIINASVAMNKVVHNTSWIPAHFHTTIGGPVFLAILGMSLYLAAKMRGRAVVMPKAVAWVPYLWFIGVMTFSFFLSMSGIMGEPRRTNLGMSYANPESPHYMASWTSWSQWGAVGGLIMTIAMAIYFIAFFRTLFGSVRDEKPAEFITSEPLHDEPAGITANLKPWVIAGVVACLLAYVVPLWTVFKGTTQGAPAYQDNSPVPLSGNK